MSEGYNSQQPESTTRLLPVVFVKRCNVVRVETETQARIDFNATWLREQRGRLGWSTAEAAAHARETAKKYGDPIKLSQQLISKFENGHFKSTPRWLGYVQIAMAHYLAGKNLPYGDVYALRLPLEMKRYFDDRQRWFNEQEVDEDDPVYPTRPGDWTSEEVEWVELLRTLPTADRRATVHLVRSLANCARTNADGSVVPSSPLGRRKEKTA